MFNVTARTSGNSFHPFCSAVSERTNRLCPSYAAPFMRVARHADRGTGCNSIIVIQPAEPADRFYSRRIFIRERPRSSSLGSPIFLSTRPRSFDFRPESEIQISSRSRRRSSDAKASNDAISQISRTICAERDQRRGFEMARVGFDSLARTTSHADCRRST